MYLKAVKLVKLDQIENHYAQTNQINQLIGKYEDIEFSVNPAKVLTELFCRDMKF